ncbi:TonB-dependent receptor [Ectothiorhodospira mobilis]|nr:TonB-dependent receptor [Ectothiorhodospira mobilis]
MNWMRPLPLLAVGMCAGGAGTVPPEASASGGAAEIELPPVEVTAGVPLPGAPMLQAADVDVLTGEALQRRGRFTLGETLEALPGVSSVTAGTQVGRPVIRGLSGDRIRILSNGIGVEYQQYGQRHPPGIDPFLAGRIEVVRGASSLLHGSGALGGAIDVQAPAFLYAPPGEMAMDGEALIAHHDHNGQRDTGLRARAGSDRFSLMAGIMRRSAGLLETPRATPAAVSGDADDPRFTGTLPHTGFQQLNGQVGAQLRTDLGTYGLRYTQWDGENDFLLPNGDGIGIWLRNDELQLSGHMPLAAGWELRPTLSWQNNLRRANRPGRPRGDGYDGTIHLETDVYTARMEALHGPLGPFDGGTLGMEYTDQVQHSRGSTVLAPGGEVSNLALFAFETRDVGDLTLQAGLRHDWHRVVGDAHRTAAPVDFSGRDAHDHRVFTGALGVVYRLSDRLALAANAGRGFRAPGLFERYADGVHGGVAAVQQGNPDLEPERALNLDLALRWNAPGLAASATLYRNDIRHYIYLQDTGTQRQGLPVFAYQQDNAVLEGVEVEVRWQATDRMEWAGSLEGVRGTNQRTGHDLPMLPADTLRLEVTYRFPSRGLDPWLRLGLRHSAAKDAAPGEPFAQFDDLPFGTASTEAYTLADLGAGLAFHGFGARPVQLELAVRNLLDREYRDFLDTYKGYALSPGREIRVSMRVPFGG